MSCIFCKIIKGESPAKKFYEDDNIIVFADILPRAKVHLLLTPKEHFSKLIDLPEETEVLILETAKKVAKSLKLEHNFRLVLNNGVEAGQIVDHLHFHFMSNQENVEINYQKSP